VTKVLSHKHHRYDRGPQDGRLPAGRDAFPPPVARALGSAVAAALTQATPAPAVTDVEHHSSLAGE